MKIEEFAKFINPLCKEPEKPKMDKDTLECDIEAIMENANVRIEKLAYQYREEVLLPYCKKMGLTFAAGNGTFVFYKDGEGIYNDRYEWLVGDDPDDPNSITIDPDIIEVLNLTTTTNNCDFSHYIQDITKEDIQ